MSTTAAETEDEELTDADLLRAATPEERRRLRERAADRALLRHEAEARGLLPTDDELQALADRFRADHDLLTAADTAAWLDTHAFSADDWLTWLEEEEIERRLRAAIVTEEAVQRRFAEERLRYDTIELYRLAVPTREAAEELRAQAEEDGIPFLTLAQRHSREASRRAVGGYLGWIGREHLSPAAEAAVFGALPAPALAGPVAEEISGTLLWCLYRIEAARTPATLSDPFVRATVEQDVFTAWLTSRRRALSEDAVS